MKDSRNRKLSTTNPKQVSPADFGALKEIGKYLKTQMSHKRFWSSEDLPEDIAPQGLLHKIESEIRIRDRNGFLIEIFPNHFTVQILRVNPLY